MVDPKPADDPVGAPHGPSWSGKSFKERIADPTPLSAKEIKDVFDSYDQVFNAYVYRDSVLLPAGAATVATVAALELPIGSPTVAVFAPAKDRDYQELRNAAPGSVDLPSAPDEIDRFFSQRRGQVVVIVGHQENGALVRSENETVAIEKLKALAFKNAVMLEILACEAANFGASGPTTEFWTPQAAKWLRQATQAYDLGGFLAALGSPKAKYAFRNAEQLGFFAYSFAQVLPDVDVGSNIGGRIFVPPSYVRAVDDNEGAGIFVFRAILITVFLAIILGLSLLADEVERGKGIGSTGPVEVRYLDGLAVAGLSIDQYNSAYDALTPQTRARSARIRDIIRKAKASNIDPVQAGRRIAEALRAPSVWVVDSSGTVFVDS